MTDHNSQYYPQGQSYEPIYLTKPEDIYGFDTTDKSAFDFTHYGTSADILAPHPEQFDTEIDSSFASFDAEVCGLPANTVDVEEIFAHLRQDTCGAPSSFTVSSESAYDSSVYGDTVSSYTSISYTQSPPSQYSGYSLTNEEMDKEFRRLGLSNTFGALSTPSSDTSSPGSVPLSSPVNFSRGSFSDYEPVSVAQIRVGSSSASDYYPQLVAERYTIPVTQATVSPANVSAQLPVASQGGTSASRGPKSDSGIGESTDPKRKYQCPSCPRAFARAFNLKTHVQTHDPNRSKPYACHHKSCGRSFSRKHDLTRHLVSIHRMDASSSNSTQSIGIEKGPRSRCDNCGKSWVGKNKEQGCDCDDVK